MDEELKDEEFDDLLELNQSLEDQVAGLKRVIRMRGDENGELLRIIVQLKLEIESLKGSEANVGHGIENNDLL